MKNPTKGGKGGRKKNSGQKRGREALEAPGLANSEAFSHQEAKIEAGDVNEHPLGDVFVVTQMGASHAAGLEGV